MKKQNLNEQVSRIKKMMGLNENESQGDNISGDKNFEVGDIVMDPVELGEDPSFYGKILDIFPNLEAAKDQPDYERTVKYLGSNDDPNDVFYLIKWNGEGTYLFSKFDATNVELAPNPELYDEKDEDDNDEEDDMCSNCNGTGEGQYDGSRCSSCGGSGVVERDRDYDDYDGPDNDRDDYDVRAKEWGGMDI